jgi:hypothetical protein
VTEPRLNAVDMSRWGGELTLEEALAMKAMGVELVIVGTGHRQGAGMFARQQARVADIAGLRVEAYIYLYMAGDAAEQVRQALATMEGLPVRRWWLDAEDVESPELSPADRRTFLHICVSILQGAKVPVGIYTGRWWCGSRRSPGLLHAAVRTIRRRCFGGSTSRSVSAHTRASIRSGDPGASGVQLHSWSSRSVRGPTWWMRPCSYSAAIGSARTRFPRVAVTLRQVDGE